MQNKNQNAQLITTTLMQNSNNHYLINITVHDTSSNTPLDTLPSLFIIPVIPLNPTVPITKRSISFSLVKSTK